MARWEPNTLEIQKTVSQHGRAHVRRGLDGTVNLAKARAPRKTGRMANSIGSRMQESRDRIKGVAGTKVKYAAAIHEGAKPHIIRPRRQGGRLRFYWEVTGRVEFFRSVRHPGVGATPFLTSAMSDACRPLGFRIIRHEGERIESVHL